MGGCSTLFLLICCISHMFAVNGEQQATHTEAALTTPATVPALKPDPSSSLQTTRGGFESPRIQLVYNVIQAFKKKVTYDPKQITRTWTGKNICRDYKGFVCDIVPGYNQRTVAGVKFNGFNFNGPSLTLTDFITGFPDLVFFHANSNNFTGIIPSRINNLQYLYELDLSNNNFSGNFPLQVLQANKLQFLDLRFNTFAGVIPPQLFLLDVDVLFINNNKFNIQRLPANLGSTTAIYLTVANNRFVGRIPRSIGQAAATLQEVLFLNNHLTGCLPYEIGLLYKATVFDVSFNQLTGPIPQSFQCLRSMDILNLKQNKFTGKVPEQVCALPLLTEFILSYNYFTQVGPNCRKLIQKGVLKVNMNCIPGLPQQRSQADCTRFLSTVRACPNQKSLRFVPCSIIGRSRHQLNSSESKPAKVKANANANAHPRGSYGALLHH